MLTTVVVAYAVWVIILISCILDEDDGIPPVHHKDDVTSSSSSSFLPLPFPLAWYAWSIGQWMYWVSPSWSRLLTQKAWRSLESASHRPNHDGLRLDIPTLPVREFDGNAGAAMEFLTTTYGRDWNSRPLLLQGLWDPRVLRRRRSRRTLSPEGLLHMNLTVPYHRDSRIHGALRPDATAPVGQIVRGMLEGYPHKIGTQFIVQTYPELLEEVAPLDFVTSLWGDYFSWERLLGHGKTLGIFPGITTVPVFIANGNATKDPPVLVDETAPGDGTEGQGLDEPQQQASENAGTCTNPPESASDTMNNKTEESPVTGLHCEPIANVAVQLHGFRKWTLVDPQHSWRLRPAISHDGRSFYPSWATSLEHVPRYEIVTHPGDALFVPTWTWHRVDYLKESADLSIGASLFHFRAGDYLRRNPLFAVLMVPALFRELAGISSQ
jgi:hypothetical protein